ncbi:MAG: sensory rhodopsin transducer [Actinomycetota bacterium]
MGEGARVWLVPDGYIPATSSGVHESHEAICVLNTRDETAELRVEFFFEEREPLTARASVPGRRTRHIRTDHPDELGGVELPRGVPYAIRIRSNVPITVQHSRLDTTQPAMALMTTLGFPIDQTEE